MSNEIQMGVLGAGGYVGGRAVQMARFQSTVRPVALIRGFRTLAKFSPAPVAYRTVNTTVASELAEGLKGLDVVVNCTLGDVAAITSETQIMVQACRIAGVQRFIHLSSAVVYGRVEKALSREDAPTDTRSWMLYAREKARTEEYLRVAMKQDGPQIVVLRPGLIWGPGSVWARMIGRELQRGMTLPMDGSGIINLVYVDDLVQRIFRVATAHTVQPGFYNTCDAETLTWKQFALAMAEAVSLSSDRVITVPEGELVASRKRVLEWALQRRSLYKLMRLVLAKLSPEAKESLKRRVYAITGEGPGPPAEFRGSTRPPTLPVLSREQWMVQTVCHPLPAEKFSEMFGPVPEVPFPEALRRTAAWLKFVSGTEPW